MQVANSGRKAVQPALPLVRLQETLEVVEGNVDLPKDVVQMSFPDAWRNDDGQRAYPCCG